MKRTGRPDGSMSRSGRDTCSIEGACAPLLLSGGTDEAEGDSRMMGSGRRCGFWFGTMEELLATVVALALGFLTMKGAASLRTCEKS
ncbi:hypothetical protein P8C59_000754 [Phyllachora maydis]|uniref:Uncharacterized protein n=1 Tax=Phyllachora maydis TaxID=1825666 RepID=A0AAD9HY24_9PEZI|nr:hypothetical protein P8C59_000754 [Phyllachora maydis]